MSGFGAFVGLPSRRSHACPIAMVGRSRGLKEAAMRVAQARALFCTTRPARTFSIELRGVLMAWFMLVVVSFARV